MVLLLEAAVGVVEAAETMLVHQRLAAVGVVEAVEEPEV
jgi:hypothetical protein